MADDAEKVVTLHTEALQIDKRRVEQGRVRVTTRTTEREEIVRQALEQDDVEIVRVPVGREIDSRPDIRQDGATTIIPIVEEILVVERRLVLREEIHLTKSTRVRTVEQPVALRSEEAVIERIEPARDGGAGSADPQKESEP